MNATQNRGIVHDGEGGRHIAWPMDGGSRIFMGSCVAQLASGMLCPANVAGAGPAIGVATMELDNTSGADGQRICWFECDRIFCFPNDVGGGALSEAVALGSIVYMSDDHTASTAGDAAMGIFYGMDTDGLVRVYVSPTIVNVVAALGG